MAVRGAKFGLGLIVATQRITRLELDVRSQCNSAMVFRMIDQGSIQAVHSMDYISGKEIRKLRALEQGQCLVAGRVIGRARIVNVRDIKTRRAKRMDFASMLGIKPPEREKHVPRIIKTENGDIIDTITCEVVESGLDRLMERDMIAFEESDGDGVIYRGHLTEDEKRILARIRETQP